MALNIKSAKVERLAADVAQMAKESKTEAIRKALAERHLRLQAHRGSRKDCLRDWLEKEVWPTIPPSERGRTMSREEEEAILGYGPNGV